MKAKISATELHYWQGPDKHLHYFFTACKKITSFKPKNKIILDSFGLNFSNMLINNQIKNKKGFHLAYHFLIEKCFFFCFFFR